ncbi:hypothetical protein HPB52_018962 [Rhipicephalus sanguineus]|uniref:Uncharacterized protein n=1 Tax=Rhipicephalus sanguineus TaxID=34632 RepID=A0A9D4SUX2_RHISA|nr:hypothetical protein HPB52_018962 [Rhipicephalus sanguineus]
MQALSQAGWIIWTLPWRIKTSSQRRSSPPMNSPVASPERERPQITVPQTAKVTTLVRLSLGPLEQLSLSTRCATLAYELTLLLEHEIDFSEESRAQMQLVFENIGQVNVTLENAKLVTVTSAAWENITETIQVVPKRTLVSKGEEPLGNSESIRLIKRTVEGAVRPHRLVLRLAQKHLELGQKILRLWHPIILGLPDPGVVAPAGTPEQQYDLGGGNNAGNAGN